MCGGGVWYQGGYTGWVPGRVYRVLPTEHAEEPTPGYPSEAGPGSPMGLEWVGISVRGWAGPWYHPAGPVGPPVALPVPGPLGCRLLANKARIDLILV